MELINNSQVVLIVVLGLVDTLDISTSELKLCYYSNRPRSLLCPQLLGTEQLRT